MKKRMISLLCVLTLLAGMLAGCGGEKETPEIKTPAVSSISPGAASGLPNSQSGADTEAPAAQPQQTLEGYYTIYAQVPASWGDVYLWAWSESIGDLYAEWPGQPMAVNADGWYAMTIPQEYDNAIVNSGPGSEIAQTTDLWTDGSDVWFVVYDNGKYETFFEDPNGASSAQAPASSSTAAAYDELFRTYGVTDVSVVSSNLDIISAAALVDGTHIQKMEYGIDGNTVKEMGMVMYYFLDGMSVQDKASLDKNMRATFDAVFAELDFVKLDYKLTSEVFTISICFKDMDDANNVSILTDFMGFTANDLKPDGTLPVPTTSELEREGLFVKGM